MFYHKRSARSSHTASPRPRRTASRSVQEVFIRAVILSFAAGICFCGIGFLLFAWLLSHTAIPVLLVRPFACIMSAAAAALSGFVLGRKVSRQYLLCGVGVGVFYAVCQLGAAFLSTGFVAQQGSDLMLPLALLLGGTLGGAFAALKAVH